MERASDSSPPTRDQISRFIIVDLKLRRLFRAGLALLAVLLVLLDQS